MSMLLDPKWQVTALAPLMRLLVGKGMATEEAAKTALGALMLPGDVYQGNVSMYGADGRTNPQVINRSADLASMLTLGSGAIPSEANSLRMGASMAKKPVPTRKMADQLAQRIEKEFGQFTFEGDDEIYKTVTGIEHSRAGGSNSVYLHLDTPSGEYATVRISDHSNAPTMGTVRREGSRQEIPAIDLRPGDDLDDAVARLKAFWEGKLKPDGLGRLPKLPSK